MAVSISTINTGTLANDGTGDNLRAAFTKVNNNEGNLAIAINNIQATYANTSQGNFTNVSVSNRVVGSLNFYGADTVYINGSAVATSAASFSGGYVANPSTFGSNLVANSATISANVSTGALIVIGGAGVSGNLNVGGTNSIFTGQLLANSTTDSSGTNSGALVTAGGIGIAKSAQIGSALTVGGASQINNTLGVSGIVSLTSGTASTSTVTGALQVTGGVGISGNLNAGGAATVTGNLTVGNLNVLGTTTGAAASAIFPTNLVEVHTFANLAALTADDGRDLGITFQNYKVGSGNRFAFAGWVNNNGYFTYYDNGTIAGNSNVFLGTSFGTVQAGNLILSNATVASSTASGALVVTGGAGIGGALYILNTGDVSANIGTVISSAATLNANVGAFHLYANANLGTATTNITTLTANAGTQQVQLNNIVSSANANSAAYFSNVTLSTANVAGGNLITTSGVFWAGNGVSYASTLGAPLASLLVGATLSSNVTASSLTTVGTLTGLTVSGAIVPNSNVSINLGSSTFWWNNVYGTALHAQYADLAERFEADAPMLPGTVIQLGGSKEITQVEQELSDDVFGVISTKAGYLMNSAAGDNETHPPVAQIGRVPVRVIGKVKKNDRLVSAGNGLARAAARNEITAWNVIGRAMSDKLDDGEGLVEAAVKLNS